MGEPQIDYQSPRVPEVRSGAWSMGAFFAAFLAVFIKSAVWFAGAPGAPVLLLLSVLLLLVALVGGLVGLKAQGDMRWLAIAALALAGLGGILVVWIVAWF